MIRLPAALLALAVGLALSGIGCGGGDGAGSTAASTSAAQSADSAEEVTIRNYEYDPATIVVPVGTVVTFTNRDSTPHTATSKRSGVFESGPIDTGESRRIKLEETGMYNYYCAFHPFMKGTIRVE